MDCKTAHDLLPLYFDGELDRATGREFEAHLDGCADCRAALVGLDELRRGLREDAPRYRAPAALRERITTSASNNAGLAGAAASTRAVVSRRVYRTPSPLRFAAAIALAFAAGGTAVLFWHSPHGSVASREQVANDLFASHWRALAATSPVDVVSSDRHTVKPWFAGKIADAPLVQDFAEQGFPLVGGRIDYVGNARVPVLVYRHGQHLIDVFVLASADASDLDASVVRKGYRIEGARLGGQPAAIVTDMDAGELAKFDQLLQQTK